MTIRQKDMENRIHAIAWYFANVSKDINKISQDFNISKQVLNQYTKRPQWHRSLDEIGYMGVRKFTKQVTRDIIRDNFADYQKAKTIYLKLKRQGVIKHKLISTTAKSVEKPRMTIYRWSKKFNWEELE